MDCFAIEIYEKSFADVLRLLSKQWALFDPFGNYWEAGQEDLPERGAVYKLNPDLTLVRRGNDWLSTTILLGGGVDQSALSRLPAPGPSMGPDWTMKFDYFLSNVGAISKCTDLAVFPSLWVPDSAEGNFVMLCRDAATLNEICDLALITPIVPAAVLRAWPRKMLEFMSKGTGLGSWQ